jgi:hypothetical protein
MKLPGDSFPDIGLTKDPTPDQVTDARAYIKRHRFDDETELLAMLNLPDGGTE